MLNKTTGIMKIQPLKPKQNKETLSIEIKLHSWSFCSTFQGHTENFESLSATRCREDRWGEEDQEALTIT